VYLWQSGSKPGTATYELEKFPSPNGTAVFNIQSLARDYFITPQYTFSTPDDTESMYVNCAVTLNWTDDAGSGTPVVLSEYFILNGYNYYLDGINYLTTTHLGWRYSSDFALRIATDSGYLEAPDCVPDELLGLTGEGYWMTDRPLAMNIPEDTSMRQYLRTTSSNIENITVNINDGDKIIKTDITGYTKKVVSFGVGSTEISASAIANSYTDTITTYEVYGEDSYGTILTQVYTFTIIEPCKWGFRNLQFMNRYGVWDNLIVYGRQNSVINVNRSEIFNNNLSVSTTPLMSYDSQRGQFQMMTDRGRYDLTVNTGWIDEDWNDIIEQLMLTEDIYDPDTLSPFTLKTKTLTYKTSLNDGLINYTLELQSANTVINSVM